MGRSFAGPERKTETFAFVLIHHFRKEKLA